MNYTFKDIEPVQQISTHYYCQWESGAKQYFPTLEEALIKAENMYVKKESMSDDNFRYWLRQKQIVGMETTIVTPIKRIFSPINVGM